MPSDKPLERLDEVVKNCERIARHVAGMSREAYLASEKTIDAVERCLQRISEAAYRLGPHLDDLYPDAPWKDARGIGNVLRHKYHAVIDDLVWTSVVEDVPRLRASALCELERLKPAPDRSVDESADCPF